MTLFSEFFLLPFAHQTCTWWWFFFLTPLLTLSHKFSRLVILLLEIVRGAACAPSGVPPLFGNIIDKFKFKFRLYWFQSKQARGPMGGGWALFLFSTLPPPPWLPGGGVSAPAPLSPAFDLPPPLIRRWQYPFSGFIILLFVHQCFPVFSASREEVVDVRHRDMWHPHKK